MLSLFRSRREQSTVVVADRDALFRQLGRFATPRSVFDAQGDQHGQIDLRLVTKIEDMLVPALGRWEQSSEWFHQMDYYGDGIRSLTFRRTAFPRERLADLQALLVGEHESFGILCIVIDRATTEYCETPDPPDEYLILLSKRIIVTRRLANELSIGA